MKIWTITTDDNGTETAVHFTEAAANAQAVEIITAWWEHYVAADQEPRDHTDWQESYSILCDTLGFMASITFTEHDISGHPAIAAAIEGTALAENLIGKLARGDLNLFTDQGAIMDAYDAVADANCLLLGKMQGDEPTLEAAPVTFTAVDGTKITPRTRADLMKHPAFAHLSVDTCGNPCVFENSYTCQSCTSEQIDWTDDWSCGCDDDCPKCGKSHSPHDQQWLANCNPHDEIGCLWESLPEAGDAPAFGAATFAEHMADQAEITEAFEAMHADPTPCERAQQIMDETDGYSDDNRRRAARVLLAIAPAYDDDTIKQGVQDAISDLLHLCDLAGWNFSEIKDAAHRTYNGEVTQLGTASDQPLRAAIEAN